jgi:hypothetical protein
MSGALPVFETKIHTGNLATDAQSRTQARKNESGPSLFPRYDGRPVMYDFEYRLWQESLRAANVSPSSTEADAARVASPRFTSGPGGTAAPLSASERAKNAATRKTAQASKGAAQRRSAGSKSPTPAEQAPTGDSAENGAQRPLPQPLSERQIVDLRRAVVEAWRKELGESRGVAG